MGTWVLLDQGKEIAAFVGLSEVCRQDCEIRAVALGLAAWTKNGLALGPGVEIVCLESND